MVEYIKKQKKVSVWKVSADQGEGRCSKKVD